LHAIYLFWVPTNDLEELISAFEEWIAKNGDENNWYMMLCAINSKGETKLLAEEGDWRGRDHTAAELLRMSYPTFKMNKQMLAAKNPPTQATL